MRACSRSTLETDVDASHHKVNVTEAVQREFEKRWAKVGDRPHLCDAKDLLAGMNRWLQREKYKTISARALSSTLRRDEIVDEMADLLMEAERRASA